MNLGCVFPVYLLRVENDNNYKLENMVGFELQEIRAECFINKVSPYSLYNKEYYMVLIAIFVFFFLETTTLLIDKVWVFLITIFVT